MKYVLPPIKRSGYEDARWLTFVCDEETGHTMMDYIKFAVYGSNGTSVPSYSNIPGQPIALDWSTQDIGVIIANVEGKYYLAMPLQSYTDIFGADFVWNGRYIFYASGLLLLK